MGKDERAEDHIGGRRAEDHDRVLSRRFAIQTSITLGLAIGGSFLGSFISAQTKQAVLETALDSSAKELRAAVNEIRGDLKESKGQITALASEMRGRMETLSKTVTDGEIKSTSAVSKLQSDVEARGREVDDLKRKVDEATSKLDEKIDGKFDWQTSRIDGLRDRVSRIEGESASKKKE